MASKDMVRNLSVYCDNSLAQWIGICHRCFHLVAICSFRFHCADSDVRVSLVSGVRIWYRSGVILQPVFQTNTKEGLGLLLYRVWFTGWSNQISHYQGEVIGYHIISFVVFMEKFSYLHWFILLKLHCLCHKFVNSLGFRHLILKIHFPFAFCFCPCVFPFAFVMTISTEGTSKKFWSLSVWFWTSPIRVTVSHIVWSDPSVFLSLLPTTNCTLVFCHCRLYRNFNIESFWKMAWKLM